MAISPPAGESMALVRVDLNEHDRATGEDHSAHAPGKICRACGRTIGPGQDARRRGEADWVHDVCPHRQLTGNRRPEFGRRAGVAKAWWARAYPLRAR